MSDGVILLVEDDVKLNNANRRALEMRNYAVHTALTLAKTRELLEWIAPDVIILDVMLPDGNGFDFCAGIRGKTDAHILFLTANARQDDVFRGLACGGDDYITKPFHAKELLLRVHAAIRRRQMSFSQKTITKGKLMLDLLLGTAFSGSKDLLLSQKEFRILLLLAENDGKTLQAEYVFEVVWGRRQISDYKNTLRNHVYELRKKLADGNCDYTIGTEYGRGYYLESLTV
ncbi:MAG: response regulator transcription factor [Treponema sp.]|jgi:DNA-binding response OmpR family regulator|nr:response regulator transcription factor [Treponema sp.]